MPDFIPVNKAAHAVSAWRRPSDFGFSRSFDMVPLLIDELAHALPTLPLAFRRRELPGGQVTYALVALLSPIAGRNLYLKADGSWHSGYLPSVLRAYPFALLTAAQGGERIVCIDRASGLLTEDSPSGSTRFFADDGDPTPEFREVMTFLHYVEQRRAVTQQAVDALVAEGVIVPWPLVVEDERGNRREDLVQVFKADGAALQKLSDDQLARLHKCGAMLIAYAQLLSEPRLQNFGALLDHHVDQQRGLDQASLQQNLDKLFGSGSETLRFDHL